MINKYTSIADSVELLFDLYVYSRFWWWLDKWKRWWRHIWNALAKVLFNSHPDGPPDFPPPDGGLLRAPSNLAPGRRSDTR